MNISNTFAELLPCTSKSESGIRGPPKTQKTIMSYRIA